MRVLFVHSEEDHYSAEKPIEGQDRMQFGISYISSVLKSEGHQTALAVPSRENPGAVSERVRSFDPCLVCFTSVYTEYGFLTRVAREVKRENPGLFMLAGGPHVALNPAECLRGPFDAVCVGEGEYPTLELAAMLEEGKAPSGIRNLWIMNGGRVERNPTRPFIPDLDSLPFPDREMWMPWLANPVSRPSLLVGRGCPFQCTYCCNHALGRLAEGRYVRVRSPGSIVAELLELRRCQPEVGEVYLEVETLGADRDWPLELCAELERLNAGLPWPFTFGSNLRVTPGKDYSGLFEALARSNFRFINIGLESGSERMRREVLKRNYSNSDVISAVRQARENGLQVGMYNLIGLPGETPREFRETIRVTRECQPDWYLLSVFFPYPGTALHDECRERGLLEAPPDQRLERRRPALELPGFSRRQVARRMTWSPLLFYGGHRPLKEIIWLVTMTRLFSSGGLLRIWRRFERARTRRKRDEKRHGRAF